MVTLCFKNFLLVLLSLFGFNRAIDISNLLNRTPIYVAKTIDNKFCAIPFEFNGKTYHDCITLGSDKPWCSLEKVFISGKSKWEYCAPHPKEFEGCLLGTPNVTAKEVEEILREHNAIRAKLPALKMRKMEWNSELAQKAQAAADKCNHDHIESILCGERFETGQNLYYNYWDQDFPSEISWSQVIDYWSREGKDFDINTLECTENKLCGHYTQVVWDKSGQIGCGKAYCHGSMQGGKGSVQYSIQYFCNYFDSGNFVGYPPYQVSKEERCHDCFTFDTDRKFRCDQEKLCEACQNDEEGCLGLEDIKMLAAAGKLCSDTNPHCAENKHICSLGEGGAWVPPPLLDLIKSCSKTCNRC